MFDIPSLTYPLIYNTKKRTDNILLNNLTQRKEDILGLNFD
jgi:hypothetical protein